jgi:hypothetical protein
MTEIETKPAPGLRAESQQERWMKYGGNVVLMSVIVILLAVLLVYIAERATKRLDTTSSGLYSLKPQTVNLIKDNSQKIQITSLYTKTKPGEAEAEKAGVVDQAEKVADLLEEYKTKGKNIEVDSIDPVSNPAKVEDLINDVTKRYGGQIDKYRAFAESYPGKYKRLTEMAAAEVDPMAEVLKASTTGPIKEQAIADALNNLSRLRRFFKELPPQVQARDNVVQKALKSKPANYKAITDDAQDSVSELSATFTSAIEWFKKAKDDAKLPESIRKYMSDSLPRFEAMTKAAEDLVKEGQSLGELKLDTLREALRQRNSILVRGEKEWKILPYDQVWRTENRSGATEAAKLKPRFAGEQMITTSILALQQPKKLKVCFVRAGGPPLADRPIQFFRPEGGVLGTVAERLRDYNYEVTEKDLTGMWAMQQMQQQQQQMSEPEPSDADIKDAVWVVIDTPGQPTQFGPAPTIAPKIAEHLANGGSAMILPTQQADDMSTALQGWGIKLHTDAMCVHELVKSEGAQGDLIEQIKRSPMYFEVRDWGSHPITSAMRSLPGIFLVGVPVSLNPTAGVKATQLIPLPDAPAAPKSWGEKDFASMQNAPPKFEPEKGDMAGPLYGGVAAEKDGAGRVVVFGSLPMFASQVVTFPDPELAKKDVYVVRFPGNGELFSNSIYWLSKQETMIAISPASMDVGRIEDLSRGAQSFWRVGVMLFGIPAAVILAGAMVYFARRD